MHASVQPIIGSISDLVLKIVCSNPSSNCYVNTCEKWPDISNLREMLKSCLQNESHRRNNLQKWTTTDRARMILVKCSSELFLKKLHHQYSKIQVS